MLFRSGGAVVAGPHVHGAPAAEHVERDAASDIEQGLPCCVADALRLLDDGIGVREEGRIPSVVIEDPIELAAAH